MGLVDPMALVCSIISFFINTTLFGCPESGGNFLIKVGNRDSIVVSYWLSYNGVR